jgi:hypothetical protein
MCLHLRETISFGSALNLDDFSRSHPHIRTRTTRSLEPSSSCSSKQIHTRTRAHTHRCSPYEPLSPAVPAPLTASSHRRTARTPLCTATMSRTTRSGATPPTTPVKASPSKTSRRAAQLQRNGGTRGSGRARGTRTTHAWTHARTHVRDLILVHAVQRMVDTESSMLIDDVSSLPDWPPSARAPRSAPCFAQCGGGGGVNGE